MCKVIHQHHIGRAPESCIEVKILTNDMAIIDLERGKAFQPGHEALGLDSPMCFYIAYDHIHASRVCIACALQHFIGLAHADRCAKEDLEISTGLAVVSAAEFGRHFAGISALALTHREDPLWGCSSLARAVTPGG